MAATQPLEYRIIKTLATKADPIHAMGQQSIEIGLIKTGRIHLKRDLRPRLKAETITQGP